MNRISINLKKGECIVFTDPDDLTKDELEEKLSSLFSINNVAILKTESTSVILRPSDISSISIEGIKPIVEIPKIEVTPPKEPAETIDKITDMD